MVKSRLLLGMRQTVLRLVTHLYHFKSTAKKLGNRFKIKNASLDQTLKIGVLNLIIGQKRRPRTDVPELLVLAVFAVLTRRPIHRNIFAAQLRALQPFQRIHSVYSFCHVNKRTPARRNQIDRIDRTVFGEHRTQLGLGNCFRQMAHPKRFCANCNVIFSWRWIAFGAPLYVFFVFY